MKCHATPSSVVAAVLLIVLSGCQEASVGAGGSQGAPSGNVVPVQPSSVQLATLATPSAATPASSSPVNTSEQRTYAVFGVKPNDVLNVRAEADPKSAKVYSFGPGVKRIKSTGNTTKVGTTLWIEVSFDGGTGWVNRQFLTEVQPGGGCNDPALTAAIRQFMRSVDTLDSGSLEELASPLRGIIVRYSAVSPDVRFAPDQVGAMYASSAVKDWGEVPRLKVNAKGSFKDYILKDMKSAVAGKGSQEKCGKLLMGNGAQLTEWPEDLQGLTLVSFHRPGGVWYTTVAGFEYVDAKPHLAALVGYRYAM